MSSGSSGSEMAERLPGGFRRCARANPPFPTCGQGSYRRIVQTGCFSATSDVDAHAEQDTLVICVYGALVYETGLTLEARNATWRLDVPGRRIIRP
jgi:hypothetical protein